MCCWLEKGYLYTSVRIKKPVLERFLQTYVREWNVFAGNVLSRVGTVLDYPKSQFKVFREL